MVAGGRRRGVSTGFSGFMGGFLLAIKLSQPLPQFAVRLAPACIVRALGPTDKVENGGFVGCRRNMNVSRARLYKRFGHLHR